MENWSVVKKSAVESILHHSNTPKILEVERPIKEFAFFRIIVPFNFNDNHYFPDMFGPGGIG